MKEIQKNRITIISRNEYQRADIQTQSKQFYFEDNHIHYENKLEIVQNTIPKINGVNVVNNLCTLKDNKLIKTTVVYFEDKLIRIEDEFYLQNYSHNVKVETQLAVIKKPIPAIIQPQIIPLISNSDRYSSSVSQRHRKKKDLKNIVKNIVKIFIHWLEKSSSDVQQCKKIMDDFLQSHKYNNSLVKAMSLNPITNKFFLSFLASSAQQSISVSRIHDKKTHFDTLKKYQVIFENGGKQVVRTTSINGSCEGGISQYKGESISDKYKGDSDNNNIQKMYYQDMNEQNDNKGSSKSSESDKLFSKSNSNENRNRSMMSSSNPENYPSGQGMSNRDNLIFFSSSGSDQ